MSDNTVYVDLGFADARLPAGTHICQIYSDQAERDEALLKFLVQGVRAGECSACFSRHLSREAWHARFAQHDIALEASLHSGVLSLADAEDVYFKDGRFDPELMLAALAGFHSRCLAGGFPAVRVIGEMLPDILDRPGGERLMEYESRVTRLLRQHPITTVCQYDAHAFDGATIMDILKVHPMMVVRGTVVHNPFFVTPEDFLGP